MSPRLQAGPSMLPQGQETVCHGLLRDPKPGGGKPAPPIAMPDPLVFYSWWNEEVATPPEFTPSGQGMGVRRQVRLHFLPRHGTFQLFTDDANAALTLAIEHSNGSAVRAIELHVGAKLDVLGRPMTLRSASARTINWIDSEAKRLLKRREGLCSQISKFADVHKAINQVRSVVVGVCTCYLLSLVVASRLSHSLSPLAASPSSCSTRLSSSQCGFAQLYLNRQMTPTDACVAPTGGKADLARLHAEIDALESLLIRYRS